MKKLALILVFLGLHIQAKSQNNTCKCCVGSFQEFAFWEGDWDVFGPN